MTGGRLRFGVGNSLFDENTFSLQPTALVDDGMGNTIGFEHFLGIEGPAVPAQFEQRPWVFGVDLDYCLSADMDACSGPDAIETNGDGRFRYSIIMWPE